MQKIKKASLTVEASLVLPIFIFATMSIIYISQLLLLEEEVQWALVRTGKEISVEYAVNPNEVVINSIYITAKMNRYVESDIKVSMLRSEFDKESGEITLIADYRAKIPFPIISSKSFFFTEKYRTRVFCGVKTRLEKEEQKNVTVYVTKSGRVYHKSLECTYLKPSISQVKYEDLKYLRSEDGSKYYNCESCCSEKIFTEESKVYICDFGNRFHSNRICKKIKRDIEEISILEVGERLPCSKCGKGK